MREFNQAELEYFKNKTDEIDLIDDYRGVELYLYPVDEQLDDDGERINISIDEALDREIIVSETIAYFIARSQLWYESIGLDPEKLRFRQHLPEERAHYASDCWDGEAYTERFGWIEINGVADRGKYDLEKHSRHSGEELGVFEEYESPETVVEREVNPDMSELGPLYKDKAQDIAKELERLARDEPEVYSGETVELEIDDDSIEIDVELAGYSEKEVRKTGENVLPQVIEPSYGLDRIVYSVMEHSFDKDRPESSEEESERQVLRLPESIAPIDVAVFPLVDKDGLAEKAYSVFTDLRENGFYVKYDDSGNIGRRYRRQDEIGTPYCVTIDYETLEDSTVTIRERDTTDQERVGIDGLTQELQVLLNP